MSVYQRRNKVCPWRHNKTAEGQGKQAIFSVLGADHYVKLVVVVDDDIDIFDEEQVLWAIATRMQADRDVFIVPDAMGTLLDPSATDAITAKMGIPGKYHETITWFFMLMVAQRRETSQTNDWHEFRDANQDLVGKSRVLLDRYYTGELLASDSAKRIFMLPDKVA